MRLRLTRLNSQSILMMLSAMLLLLGGTLNSVSAQSLRIVDSSAATAPAAVSGADYQAILTQGDTLRGNARWRDLTEHYKKGLERFPNSDIIRSRYHASQAREDVERRYSDTSFCNSVRTLTDRDAIDLYSELLTKVQSHYVDTPNWSDLVNRGLVFAREAVHSDRLQGTSTAGSDAFRALDIELARHLSNRPINNVRDAREAAWFAGQLAKQRTGIPAAALMLEFVAGATAALDPYSTFLTPDQLDEVFSQIEGNFVGLGIELEMEPKALQIVNVIPGGPAALAGVRPGDRFSALDGKAVEDVGASAAANSLRGEEGTAIDVVLIRDGATQRIRIVRRVVEVPSVVDIKIIDERNKVGYFKLASFQKSTSRDVDNALWKLHKQGMRSLIMDLRGNPGGLLDASVQVADKFLKAGAIVSTRGRTEQFEFNAHQEGTWAMPLVVLIDGDSASASEILAGALRDHQRAQVVGTRSYGKGSVQGIFPLAIGKSGVRLTTAKFYSPSGRAISKNGVLPTTQVQVTAKVPVAQMGLVEKDSVLSSAVQVALRQMSGGSRQNAGLTVTQSNFGG